MNTDQFDVIGIGVGPANLALVAAIMDAESQGEEAPSALFLERSLGFAWHPGMLLPGSRLQVSYLKDLATQRNPRSRYTFLNYIFEQGRIEEFINLREMNPDREEYVEYMTWVADCAGRLLEFDSTVTELRPLPGDGGTVERIEVSAKRSSGEVRRHRAKAIVIATGREPYCPPGVAHERSDRIVHTSDLLPRIAKGVWRKDMPLRLAIVGGGQSAIEVACYLLREFPMAVIEILHRGYVLDGVDDNPYVNESYYGKAIDRFYGFDRDARRRSLADVAASNFDVVERRLLDELYRYQYDGLRTRWQRVSILHGHEVVSAEGDGQKVRYAARNLFDHGGVEQHVDGLVLATGYREMVPASMQPLMPWLEHDESNGFRLGRDYRIASDARFRPQVFLHGTREDLHGPAELNLSTHALRAGVLLDALRGARRSEDRAETLALHAHA